MKGEVMDLNLLTLALVFAALAVAGVVVYKKSV
jgi:hypothetical protein